MGDEKEPIGEHLMKLGLDTERVEQFHRLSAIYSPQEAILRVIADLTDDTRLPGRDQESVGAILRRFRSWQGTVRRISEVYAAPRGA